MRKQLKVEPVEYFCVRLNEITDNCYLAHKEEVRDVFVAILLDRESQRQLLLEARKPENAKNLAMNNEIV